MGTVVELKSEDELNTYINSYKYCFLDFYATWCKPCTLLSNFINDHVLKLRNNFIIVKINVDKFDTLSDKFEVDNIPHIVYYMNKEKQKITFSYSTKEYFFDILNDNEKT